MKSIHIRKSRLLLTCFQMYTDILFSIDANYSLQTPDNCGIVIAFCS